MLRPPATAAWLALLLLTHALLPFGSLAHAALVNAAADEDAGDPRWRTIDDNAAFAAVDSPDPRRVLASAAFFRVAAALRAVFGADAHILRTRARSVQDAIAALCDSLVDRVRCVRDTDAQSLLGAALADGSQASLARLAENAHIRETLADAREVFQRVVAGDLLVVPSSDSADAFSEQASSSLAAASLPLNQRIINYCESRITWFVASSAASTSLDMDLPTLRILLAIMWGTALYAHVSLTAHMMDLGFSLRRRMVAHVGSLFLHFAIGAGMAELIVLVHGDIDGETVLGMSLTTTGAAAIAVAGDVLGTVYDDMRRLSASKLCAVAFALILLAHVLFPPHHAVLGMHSDADENEPFAAAAVVPPAYAARDIVKTAAFFRVARALRFLFHNDAHILRTRVETASELIASLRASLASNLQCVRDKDARELLRRMLTVERVEDAGGVLAQLTENEHIRRTLGAARHVLSRVIAGELRLASALFSFDSTADDPPTSHHAYTARWFTDFCERHSSPNIWSSLPNSADHEIDIDIPALRIMFGVLWGTALCAHISLTTRMIEAGYPLRQRMLGHIAALAVHLSLGASFAALIVYLHGDIDCETIAGLAAVATGTVALAAMGDSAATLAVAAADLYESASGTNDEPVGEDKQSIAKRLRTHVPARIVEYEA